MDSSGTQDSSVIDAKVIEECQQDVYASSLATSSSEFQNCDSSDTSALMELAEIACNSTKRPASPCDEGLNIEDLIPVNVSNPHDSQQGQHNTAAEVMQAQGNILKRKHTLTQEIPEIEKEEELPAHVSGTISEKEHISMNKTEIFGNNLCLKNKEINSEKEDFVGKENSSVNKDNLEQENSCTSENQENISEKLCLAEEGTIPVSGSKSIISQSEKVPVLVNYGSSDKETEPENVQQIGSTNKAQSMSKQETLKESVLDKEKGDTVENSKDESISRIIHKPKEDKNEKISMDNVSKNLLSVKDLSNDDNNSDQKIVSNELIAKTHTESVLSHDNTTNEEYDEADTSEMIPVTLQSHDKQKNKDINAETFESSDETQSHSAVLDESEKNVSSERLSSEYVMEGLEACAELSSISSVVESVQLTEEFPAIHRIHTASELTTDTEIHTKSDATLVCLPINDTKQLKGLTPEKSQICKEGDEQDHDSDLLNSAAPNSDLQISHKVSATVDEEAQNISNLHPEDKTCSSEKEIASNDKIVDVVENIPSTKGSPESINMPQNLDKASVHDLVKPLESNKNHIILSVVDGKHASSDDPSPSDEIGDQAEDAQSNIIQKESFVSTELESNKCNVDPELESNKCNVDPELESNKCNVDLSSEALAKESDNVANNTTNTAEKNTNKHADKEISVNESGSCSKTDIKFSQYNKPVFDNKEMTKESESTTTSIEINTDILKVKDSTEKGSPVSLKEKRIEELDNEEKSFPNSQKELVSIKASNWKNAVGKLFIRNDLTESKSNMSEETISNEPNKNIPLEKNISKKRSPELDNQILPKAKRVNKTLVEEEEDNDESDVDDEDKLIIDEDSTSSAPKRKSQKVQMQEPSNSGVKSCKKKTAATNIRSQIWIADFAKAPPASLESTGSSNLLMDKNKKATTTPAVTEDRNSVSGVEVVDLVEKEKESPKTNEKDALFSSKNHICEKCKSIWNDRILKCLFEGNESVTINSRISYGAIICMNIYVAVHYPDVKEQAILGLLDRADLAKNLGSIKVSILNSWLVALIKNKKISCCDPFRPIYNKVRTPSSKEKNSAKGAQSTGPDKTADSAMQRIHDEKDRSDSSLSNESEAGGVSKSSATAVPEIVIDDGEDENAQEDQPSKKGAPIQQTPSQVQKATPVPMTQSSLPAAQQEPRRYVTNECIYKKLISKISPALYNTIRLERESLSPNLHGIYDKLTCDTALTENEIKNLKRGNLTNKEVLDIHSLCILSANEIFVEDYFKLFIQILHHRGHVLLIPTGKILVKYVEYLRREHNRQKMALKLKGFANFSWDADHLYAVPFLKNDKAEGEYPTIREILTVFCEWKNRNLLKPSQNKSSEKSLRNGILKLFNNAVKINDCFGLCVRLYARYCHLKYDQSECEESKTKFFLNLYYLPKQDLESVKNKTVFDTSMSLFPPASKDIESTVSYLQDQTQTANNVSVKRYLPDDIIDSKIEQIKKLKTDILTVKSAKSSYLLNSYAKLKNEIDYLETPIEISLASGDDLGAFNKQMASYTPEVKLMVAKLRGANVPFENIPSIIDTLFKSFLKRKVPVSF